MAENPDLKVVNAFVDELYRAGIRHVCVSPGSRSTPITIAAARHGEFRLWSLLDERSAGFFALGLARSLGEPVVLVCTSGTATANYYPAVMEAAQTRVPLVLLTADRPPELQGVGANQTVDQRKLYGSFVKHFIEMPIPQDSKLLFRHAASAAWRAVASAAQQPPGPVHVNWPLREPLVPPVAEPSADGLNGEAATGHLVSVRDFVRSPDPAAVQAVCDIAKQKPKGLIVCGPQDHSDFARTVSQLAETLHIPVLADPLSQLRCGPHPLGLVVEAYDVLLRDNRWFERLRPDFILRFGGVPTSKVLGQYLQDQTQARQIVIEDGAMWRDPFFTATDVVFACPRLFCEALMPLQSPFADGPDSSFHEIRKEWTQHWVSLNEAAQTAIREVFEKDVPFTEANRFTEGRVVVELAQRLREGTTVFAGNSMPIRDIDSFFPKQDKEIRFFANRGVSGIDGVVSTALGTAAANSGPTVLLIGDVSFYHDLNALLIAARNSVNLLVILIHNDGGGIFSFLPQAGYPETFEHFRTSHGMDFEPAVTMFGGRFTRVQNWSEFRDQVEQAQGAPGLTVLEVRTEPDENVQTHRKVFAQAAALAASMWGSGSE
ncbi:2-succinyl-5-enolpyruvyl-6-hydroxy-3-cyclohexene-1-carboxylic-acid synthase [Alicyclobacillus tolerans]|uniref:2-succinyl-5-enolpyruvyl-6-hydroxy-3- cyclohexene-1-carboxylic-acid synthase n=1 Tax=Alicyclobacillus tolerans TaxID=90970 RepID=UPI001F0116BF|nr:2-succinyl-5-enolpyruvyl-6-hydroxy-3-cyclohexene-1-carboxylic-acid synthase [Alicyclobacillus tolerans]MCF8563421.1 2-succinyl-5-enolpyruvyl-6-hydroxy-3-cyclohexene-1-carboxylic-acid synthase [Alicyclobacillus tolerans]